jgi:probable rRNA maturation factor
MEFAVRTTVRGPVPRIQFERIAQEILGNAYSLSLVICGDTLGRRLNTEYRKKTYKPNVLSFPLSKKEGEIFLNVRKAGREAQAEGSSLTRRSAFLFIHACLHLKGLDHGNKMDALEQKHLKNAGFL